MADFPGDGGDAPAASPPEGSRALADTPAIAGSARAIPIRASAVGRSPSSSPASTENPAAPTALSGPATLNAACRNPRYSASAPVTPARPAAAPQATARGAGEPAPVSTSARLITARLTAVASRVTRITLARRLARPAAKSEPP